MQEYLHCATAFRESSNYSEVMQRCRRNVTNQNSNENKTRFEILPLKARDSVPIVNDIYDRYIFRTDCDTTDVSIECKNIISSAAKGRAKNDVNEVAIIPDERALNNSLSESKLLHFIAEENKLTIY